MRVLIVAPSNLPIPNIGGGAIETLVTYVLNENEIKKSLDIDVITHNHHNLITEIQKYSKTKFIIFDYNKKIIYKIYDFIRRILRKISGRKIDYQGLYYWFIKRYLKKNGNIYDRIIFEGDIGQPILSPDTKDKNILHIHTDIFYQRTTENIRICNCVDKIITVSDFIKDRVSQISDKVAIDVLLNCADTSKFVPVSTKEKIDIRNTLGFADGDFIVLFTGRLDDTKGVKELMNAILSLPDNIKLVIAGGNFYSDSTITSYMKELVKISKEKPGKFTFTGNLQHTEVAAYYKVADVVAVPSKCNEAAGLSLIEGRVSGKPVITTDKGGIPEYSDRGCLIINDETKLEEKLNEYILRLYNDETLINRLSEENCNNRNFLSKERYYDDFVNIISK